MTAWVRHKAVLVLLFGVAVAVLAGAVFRVGYGQALDQLAQRGEADLTLAADRLTAQLQRYQEMAVLLSDHPDLKVLTTDHRAEDVAEARALLREAADKTAALDLIYALPSGQVLAAARGEVETAERLHAAPHFQRALHGALGIFHGVSARFGNRAFYFAAPAFASDGKVASVLTVVVDVENVETDWRGDRPAVFFTDTSGEVFISNRSELLFWERDASGGLTPDAGPAPPFQDYTRFGHELWRLDWGPYVPQRGLHLVKPLPIIGMTGEAVVDVEPALRLAGLQATVVAALCLAFGLFLYQAIGRRQVLAQANAVLEERVTERTSELSAANAQLRREISERLQAEDALRQAQAELVQAGKLSALGQMSAGISHELNQPLMAIQQFAENGATFLDRGNSEKAGENLSRISGLAARAARIIRNLRAFSRNESEPVAKVDLATVVDAAVELSQTRLREGGVTLNWSPPSTSIMVRGGEVRLGQVLVNLINNAADAMAESPKKEIDIVLSQGRMITLTVQDTGPGLTETDKIFDPFYTTKEIGHGEGMGLGLSISYGLVQSFGGNIRGGNAAEGGAIFTVELEPWQDEAAA